MPESEIKASGHCNKRLRKAAGLPVSREEIPSYAWPGGYVIAYVMADGGALCGKCVREESARIDTATKDQSYRTGWELTGHQVEYEPEDSDMCDNCGRLFSDI